jgi:Cu+-exporting ATPase
VSTLDPSAEIPKNEKEAERLGFEKLGLFSTAVEWVRETIAARRRGREEAGYVPLQNMAEH